MYMYRQGGLLQKLVSSSDACCGFMCLLNWCDFESGCVSCERAIFWHTTLSSSVAYCGFILPLELE